MPSAASLLLLVAAASAGTANAAVSFSLSSSFVPPASPSIATSSPAPTGTIDARRVAVATGYGTFHNKADVSSTTALWSKKKKGGAAKKVGGVKVQVKMLKDVPGTGQRGEVIMVTPAFFQNKLRPSQSARKIEDDEVKADQDGKKAEENASVAAATALQEKISGISMEIARKAGPDGQLFGGVGPKCIIDELRKEINDDFLSGKGVKVLSILDEEGNELDHDIKHTGDFSASISLRKDINAKLTVSISAIK